MWVASDHIRPGKTRVVIISSGSVASIKLPLIVQALVQVGSCGYYREKMAVTLTTHAPLSLC